MDKRSLLTKSDTIQQVNFGSISKAGIGKGDLEGARFSFMLQLEMLVKIQSCDVKIEQIL